MENKCNKTPNNSNTNATNNKYMDHVYCHTNQSKNPFSVAASPSSVGGGSASSPNGDVLALLKENKQLKAMLILHLDLIQEQSDQLMAKEKILITHNEELESLRTRNAILDNQVKDLQKQLQHQIKRSGEISSLPPPPLAKIQCKSNQSIPGAAALVPVSTNCAKIVSKTGTAKSNIIGVCNGKLISKIVLQRVNASSSRGKHNQSPESQTTDTENDEDVEENGEDEEEEVDGEIDCEDDGVEDEDEVEIHQEENLEHEEEGDENLDDAADDEVHFQDSVDEKSNTQTVVIDDMYDTGNTTEDSNEVLAVQSKRLRLRQAAKLSLSIPRGAKPSISPASTTTNDGQTTFKAVTSSSSSSIIHLGKQLPPTPSRGKQMTIMRWHAPDYNTDESVSCDSAADLERRSTSTVSSSLKPSPNLIERKRSHNNPSKLAHHPQKVRRCTHISTPKLYSTREWEDEAFICNDYAFIKAEDKLFQADNPKLEIPKWTEHELTPSYCIEGTEDLSDEIFLKRHAKLEVDEKRRKKWDVQQIREQRRIERLKRRHCKDELQPTQDTPSLQTFYPTTESLQTICYVQELPVQAFGEMIPRLTSSGCVKGENRKGFQLPWMDKDQLQYLSDNNKIPTVSTLNSSEIIITGSLQIQQQMLNSCFTFLKKRRRQQSSSIGSLYNNRQRNISSKNTHNPSSVITVTPAASTETFLNIAKSSVAASSVTTATSLTTTIATNVVACGSKNEKLCELTI